MCLIVVLPAGVELSREQVRDARTYNPDGVGIMWSDPATKQLAVRRTMQRRPGRIWSFIASAPIETERVVHFRRTTRGATHVDNTHPFVLHGRFGIMHNGTLPETLAAADVKVGRSDTAVFVEDVLAKLGTSELTNHTLWHLISHAVEGNRMIMLDGETGYTYFANAGEWHTGIDGMLLSNTYAIQSGKLWGVTRSSGWWQSSAYQTGLYAPSSWGGSSATASSASGSAYTGKVSTTQEAVDDILISSAYTTDDLLVPVSPKAWQHPLLKAAEAAISRISSKYTLPSSVARSTMVLSFLHASRFTEPAVERATDEELAAELGALITYFNPLPATAGRKQREDAFWERAREMRRRFTLPPQSASSTASKPAALLTAPTCGGA